MNKYSKFLIIIFSVFIFFIGQAFAQKSKAKAQIKEEPSHSYAIAGSDL